MHLYGSLKTYRDATSENGFRMPLSAPTPLPDILADGRIPGDRVQLVMVNHRAVPQDTLIHPGDRVSLFPAEYAVFADWKDFRK